MATDDKRTRMRTKHPGSIKIQFALTFMAISAGMIALLIVTEAFFLHPYYIQKKTDAIRQAYNSINTAGSKGDLYLDDFDRELQRICAKFNIQMIILDSDSRMIKSASGDSDRMARLLWKNILGYDDGSSITQVVEKTRNYTLQTEEYTDSGTKYMVCWGYLDNGSIFMIDSALDSIDETAGLSVRFIAAVGLVAMAIGAVVIYFITGMITRPITDLSALSDDMKRMNFGVRYEGRSNNELDLLGENLNGLSEELEKTIGELKNANNELLRDIEKKEKIDEDRREFISNISHELKTPIALIQGYAEGLGEGVTDDEESRRYYCEVIMDESRKMNGLVKKLLTLSHLESGENAVNFERFDITEMIKNYLRSASILLEKSGASVRMDDQPPTYVWADEFLVEEVLQNYVTNAINHLDGEKVIEIRMRTEGSKVRVSVFNTGEPIPEESVGLVWDKFYKTDRARTRSYGGSGIGLSIVKAIMEAMHSGYGLINYDNGVEFWFELELSDNV